MRDLNELPFEDEEGPAPPTLRDYDDFQRRYGLEIPAAMRRLLEFRNGGKVRRLWVASKHGALEVDRFLSLNGEDSSPSSIAGNFRGWREAMGKMGLPLAENAEGLFFLDTSTSPALVKYARQESNIKVYTISPDLDTFLAGLNETEPEVCGGKSFIDDEAVPKVAPEPPAKPRKKGCCSVKVVLIGLALLLPFLFWPRKPIWVDGNLRVYEIDGEYMLGTYHNPGYFGLLDGQIVAMGSNEQWVVAVQRSGWVSSIYLLKKPTDELSPSDVEGPYTGREFEDQAKARGLPPVTWQNPWLESLKREAY